MWPPGESDRYERPSEFLVLAADTAEDVEDALCDLIGWNRRYLRLHPDTPSIYDAGVRYARESARWRMAGEERFVCIPLCIFTGFVDCDDAVAWRCAELLEQGVQAFPIVRQVDDDLYHCLVGLPGGFEEDPSAKLGMIGGG